MSALAVWAPGKPIPQGSKTRGRWGLYDDHATTLKPWREIVTVSAQQTARARKWQTTKQAVRVDLLFAFERPRSHFGTGRNSARLRSDAPARPITTPSSGDIDKLTRAILDALTAAKIWRDDVQVAVLVAAKVWAGSHHTLPEYPGARITITELP